MIKILLVEDNPGDAYLIQNMLTEAGGAAFDLTHFEQLADGLVYLAVEKVDLILLDLLLPDSYGLETFTEMQSQASQIPVIVLTGLDSEELAIKAVRAGAQDYLIKGEVDGHLLVRAIRYAIERKRTEETLKQLSSVVEQTADLVIITDRDGIIEYVNPAFEMDTGYSMVEVVGKTPRILKSGQHSQKFYKNLWETIYSGQAFRAVIVNRKKDGTLYWEEKTITPIRDARGNITHFVSTGKDITERKHVEMVLRQRNRELALINQVGQQLTATLDRQQVAERLLQAVTDLIGTEGASLWLRDEQDAQWLRCWALFHHREPQASSSDLRFPIDQGIAGWVARTGERAIVPDVAADPRFFSGIDEQTDLHTTSLLAVPLRVRSIVIGVLEVINKVRGGFTHDDLALVETLATSAAIAMDNAGLIEKLRQRTVELQARNEELDAFSHTVAHDLKGPLGYMVGFAETLHEQHITLSPQELRRHLRIIAQKGRKMGHIIDDLLLLAGVRKIDEIPFSRLYMASIVNEALARLSNLIEEYQAEIILPESWPVALGYGPWVEEVWVNYISNAIKYGGHPPRVELGSASPADCITTISEMAQAGECFYVRDHGAGLTLEEQARLFTLFTRLDQVRTKGHGLGLSIVRRIVERLGGEVGVESELGQGSTFFFTLPGVKHQE